MPPAKQKQPDSSNCDSSGFVMLKQGNREGSKALGTVQTGETFHYCYVIAASLSVHGRFKIDSNYPPEMGEQWKKTLDRLAFCQQSCTELASPKLGTCDCTSKLGTLSYSSPILILPEYLGHKHLNILTFGELSPFF